MNTIPHVSIPTAGFYQLRLVKDGPWVPVRIWRGFGADPLTGEIIERGWIWRAELNGAGVPVDRVWPYCAGEPIERAEYDYMLAMIDHATRYEPAMPEANPWEKIDWGTLKFDFGAGPD